MPFKSHSLYRNITRPVIWVRYQTVSAAQFAPNDIIRNILPNFAEPPSAPLCSLVKTKKVREATVPTKIIRPFSMSMGADDLKTSVMAIET